MLHILDYVTDYFCKKPYYFSYFYFVMEEYLYSKSSYLSDMRYFNFCQQVFSSFATAAIRIRTSGYRNSKFFGINGGTKVDTVSEYDFGMVLKETMLSLGPTFIKG